MGRDVKVIWDPSYEAELEARLTHNNTHLSFLGSVTFGDIPFDLEESEINMLAYAQERMYDKALLLCESLISYRKQHYFVGSRNLSEIYYLEGLRSYFEKELKKKEETQKA